MKRWRVLVMCCVLACSCLLINVSAYVHREDEHDMGGGCVGKVQLGMSDSYAAASTYATGSMTYCEVSVDFTYGFNKDEYTVSGRGIGSTRPVSVNRKSDHYGSVGISAESQHIVTANDVTWKTSLSVRA